MAEDPFALFAAWYAEARDSEVNDSNAMAVASVGADGQPSVRMVLLKGHDERGFVFYTNYDSRKARELMISFWLEAWLTKDEILSRYLSNVYFGDNVYGLTAAARDVVPVAGHVPDAPPHPGQRLPRPGVPRVRQIGHDRSDRHPRATPAQHVGEHRPVDAQPPYLLLQQPPRPSPLRILTRIQHHQLRACSIPA